MIFNITCVVSQFLWCVTVQQDACISCACCERFRLGLSDLTCLCSLMPALRAFASAHSDVSSCLSDFRYEPTLATDRQGYSDNQGYDRQGYSDNQGYSDRQEGVHAKDALAPLTQVPAEGKGIVETVMEYLPGHGHTAQEVSRYSICLTQQCGPVVSCTGSDKLPCCGDMELSSCKCMLIKCFGSYRKCSSCVLKALFHSVFSMSAKTASIDCKLTVAKRIFV